MPKPVAVWNSARDVWETPGTEGFFCEHLDVFLGTFPTSGMTVNGAAYELPTWDPAMDVSASLSLLPTVTTQDGANNGGPSQFDRNTPPLNTRVLMLDTPTAALAGGVQTLEVQVGGRQKFKTLPTPTVSDTNGPGKHGDGGLDLRTTVSLLPTPMANPTGRSPEAHLAMRQDMGRTGATDLGAAVSLLPTPAAMDGSGGRITKEKGGFRESGAKRSITLGTVVHHDLTPTGETTPQPSDAGNESSDGQLQGQLNLLDAITDTD